MGCDAEDFRLDLEGPSRRSSLATDALASDGSVTSVAEYLKNIQ